MLWALLRVITQTYDFESNSQLHWSWIRNFCSCESSRKPMILKAIHNSHSLRPSGTSVASHHANLWFWKQFTTESVIECHKQPLRVITQTYDFESNSQLVLLVAFLVNSCESSRKPMILKAIHNGSSSLIRYPLVASHHANLWFWKQFTTSAQYSSNFFLLRVITQTYDFESNSQQFY